MGAEADFLGVSMLTISVALASGILMVAARFLAREWGILSIAWLALIGVHIIQDSVLAWAAYSR
jgi:hypothetical protein